MPRVRFTVRRMMVAVAVLAAVFALLVFWLRADRFATILLYHDAALPALVAAQKARPDDEGIARKIEWHILMRDKYLKAAHYPWLPVEPDPPEPK